MSEPEASLLQFPCEFPIKAFGFSESRLEAAVWEIVNRHAPGLTEDALTSRPSGGGKYIAVTVILCAQSQAQLDAIYHDLTACSDVIMAL